MRKKKFTGNIASHILLRECGFQIIHQNLCIMTKGQKATAVLNYLEELDPRTILNLLDCFLSDEALSLLYDKLVEDGAIEGEKEDED